MWIYSQLYAVLVIIAVKPMARLWNVFTGGSSFFKGTFLTKAIKSIIYVLVDGVVSCSLGLICEHNFNNSDPSWDLVLFLIKPSLPTKKRAELVISCRSSSSTVKSWWHAYSTHIRALIVSSLMPSLEVKRKVFFEVVNLTLLMVRCCLAS